jgi:hypothetical protein
VKTAPVRTHSPSIVGRLLLASLVAMLAAGDALGTEHAPAEDAPAEHGAAAVGGEEAQRTDILDLGAFRIRSSRSTDREITDVKFSLEAVLSTDSTPADFHRLASWQKRLRDQVIIAVRGADPAEFLDPELRRLHRLILFRVKRLAIGDEIIGVYLTDFALDHGENIAEQYQPAIIPSAPKPPAEGGGEH